LSYALLAMAPLSVGPTKKTYTLRRQIAMLQSYPVSIRHSGEFRQLESQDHGDSLCHGLSHRPPPQVVITEAARNEGDREAAAIRILQGVLVGWPTNIPVQPARLRASVCAVVP